MEVIVFIAMALIGTPKGPAPAMVPVLFPNQAVCEEFITKQDKAATANGVIVLDSKCVEFKFTPTKSS
jgi:hypothetical protein